MKKIIMVLLITSMVLGTLTGCSNVKEKIEGIAKAKDDIQENVEEISKFKDDIKENVEEVSKLKDDIQELIDTEVTDADQTTDSDSDEEAGAVADDIWGKIAKYKVDNIIEEKLNGEIYMLVYISKEETANLVDYFDELLKETEDYNCEKVTEKEVVIDGYLRGTINEYSIIVAVEYDNVNDENRVEFTSYKK